MCKEAERPIYIDFQPLALFGVLFVGIVELLVFFLLELGVLSVGVSVFYLLGLVFSLLGRVFYLLGAVFYLLEYSHSTPCIVRIWRY